MHKRQDPGGSHGDAPKRKKAKAGWQRHGHTVWRKPEQPEPQKKPPASPAGAIPKPASGKAAAPPQQPKQVPSAAAIPKPASSAGAIPKSGKAAARATKPQAPAPGSPASPSSASATPALKSDDPGAATEHVLLLLGLPPGTTELQLQRELAVAAPLQLQLLRDWSTGEPRRAACVAVASPSAAAAVRQAAGASWRVCGVGESAAAERGFGASVSAAMRVQLEQLAARASAALASTGGGGGGAPSFLAHLLLCCATQATAERAVAEFVRTAGSGQLKKAAALLEGTLLRHRRADGGQLWRGRVRGLPLPEAAAARLRRLLEQLDWSAMPAEGKLRGAMADNSFKLGLSTKAWSKSNNGPYAPFAFKEGMGVWDAASVRRRHAELWAAASELMTLVDPSYHWTSVQFNKNFRGSRHRDDKDASFQVATAFGEYTGGELRVHGQKGALDVDTRGRFVRFDGRYEHEVLPYEGTRYSVIYFQLEPEWSVDPSSCES